MAVKLASISPAPAAAEPAADKPKRRSRFQPVTADPVTVSVADASRLVGLCERTLREWAELGWEPARKVGKRLLFDYSALRAWAAAGCPEPRLPKAGRKPPKKG
jgi:hypothetical protein